MTLDELHQQLLAAGCNPNNYAIGNWEGMYDGICLAQFNNEWHIFYAERGQQQQIFSTFESQDMACQAFLHIILNMEHRHLVGFFQTSDAAEALCNLLTEAGLSPIQDMIPYSSGPSPVRYRVFVVGKEIFKARETLGENIQVSTT
ncbi:MAG: hypothetical protein GFH27_549289n384 [Chloroflexi bacterium AL-W]|nr:hypothetical protein [Chloroflexi bacterium AL-N1]NOK67116.1 hypothetical protein [Chloroflexi bacterium AL-N10]NOK74591.1 hypothetical protein [Chloroflexi bacterium AL-N5]NOK81718.1 hypothetical protein [Chloroflexi bacterium AL-W]NOK89188.1 hypothetical protein [Chloroflexi bacterium AL-N15]